MLLRPIIDVFWFLKETSLFSPLQLAGLLTFFFSAVFGFKLPSSKKGGIPIEFSLFSGLLLVNLFLISAEVWTAGSWIAFVRFSTPIALFIYLLKVMKNESRFLGFVYTFLASSIFPLSMLYYEAIFDPITQVPLSESRGGGFRLTGLYADLFNYMSYVIGDFFLLSYLFVRLLSKPKSKQVGILKIAAVLLLAIVGLIGLKHQASWIVFLFILVSVVVNGFRHARVKQYLLVIGIPALLITPVVILPTLERLFSKELNAYSGEADSNRTLNGRFIRWERYFDLWVDIPLVPKLTGVSFSKLDEKKKMAMTGGGMHSDYVRFLFATGIIGLISLLLFYFRVLLERKNFRKSEKFFITTSVGIMCLYGVTSNPFGSSGSLMFVLFSGMAISLNKAKLFYTEPARPSNKQLNGG
ncbi:O-antigen ligase family protein [Bacteroidota bacterium]